MLECHKITEKLLPDQILNLNTNRFKGFRHKFHHKQPSIGNWEFEVVSGTHDLRTPPIGLLSLVTTQVVPECESMYRA